MSNGVEDRFAEMITIPAGDFPMGSKPDDPYAGPKEFPQHRVYVDTFQIGKYQVTRGNIASSSQPEAIQTRATGRRKAGNGKTGRPSRTR